MAKKQQPKRRPKRRRLGRKLFWTLVVLGLAIVLFGWYTIGMPARSFSGPLPPATAGQTALQQRLARHVEVLAREIGERNLDNYEALQGAARYIRQAFAGLGYEVASQPFTARGQPVENLEVQIDGAVLPREIVVVGAHYDSAQGTPGANDNGSGVAALLELSRLLAKRAPPRTVRFVAFVNEEPPYFKTHEMGSLQYARRCQERGEQVVAMLSLETIGYYDDEPGSQRYPFPLSLFYPDTGNFIGVVGNVASRSLVHRVMRSFREQVKFPSEGAAAPGFIPGIGWSDHWAFWQAGYRAVMITDTAPFRYPHYHGAEDLPDQIDYARTARVVDGLARVIGELADQP